MPHADAVRVSSSVRILDFPHVVTVLKGTLLVPTAVCIVPGIGAAMRNAVYIQ